MPSLTLAEARERAAHLSEVSYAVELDLTDPETFGTRTVVRFRSASPQTFLELSGAVEIEVRVNDATADATYDGNRIDLIHLATGPGDDGVNEIEVDARVPYVTDGDGMHRTVDPADGETYVGAYLGMDIAHKVIACFDQNDLKATFDVAVIADPTWTVLANGATVEQEAGRWRFATTPPIPPALLVVAAGPWASVRWQHAGLDFAWHARASLAAELARDAEELKAATIGCFDHYAEIFAEPYPFDTYDQVFVPGLNWGAQEMPGCVTYRDELLPRGAVPEDLRLLRTAVIAHEMAHMWFGDLVTMTWWEDTWLQESFADYLGYRVAADGAATPGALVGHEAGRKPTAYDADERRSTHPVAPDPEDVPDVDAAMNIFDAISYAKGNSVLRQLATWLGDDAFLAGVNTYLSRHRFANATLADFVTALDEASDRDVHAWVQSWLRTSGFDTIRVELDGDVPVLLREGSRAHRIRVTAYDDGWVETGTAFVDVADEPIPLPELAGRRVVPNSHGETFARIVLDPATAEAVASGLCRIDDELVRAVLWTMLADQVHTRALDPTAYVELVVQHLPGERSVTLVSAALERTLDRVLPLRLPAAAVPAALNDLASACATGLLHATTPERALAFATGVAATSSDADTLRSWLDADAAGTLPLSPALRWRVVRRLAELGAADADLVEAERRRDPGTDADLGAAAALAARPSADAKAEAWGGRLGPGRRQPALPGHDARPVGGRPGRAGGAVRRALPARGRPLGDARAGVRAAGGPRPPDHRPHRRAGRRARRGARRRRPDRAAAALGGLARRPGLTPLGRDSSSGAVASGFPRRSGKAECRRRAGGPSRCDNAVQIGCGSPRSRRFRMRSHALGSPDGPDRAGRQAPRAFEEAAVPAAAPDADWAASFARRTGWNPAQLEGFLDHGDHGLRDVAEVADLIDGVVAGWLRRSAELATTVWTPPHPWVDALALEPVDPERDRQPLRGRVTLRPDAPALTLLAVSDAGEHPERRRDAGAPRFAIPSVSWGAGGRIDLVAEDPQGHRTIVAHLSRAWRARS